MEKNVMDSKASLLQSKCCLFNNYKGEPPKTQNYLLEGGPLVVSLIPLGEHSRDISVLVCQLVLL